MKTGRVTVCKDDYGIQVCSGYECRDATMSLSTIEDVIELRDACNEFLVSEEGGRTFFKVAIPKEIKGEPEL